MRALAALLLGVGSVACANPFETIALRERVLAVLHDDAVSKARMEMTLFWVVHRRQAKDLAELEAEGEPIPALSSADASMRIDAGRIIVTFNDDLPSGLAGKRVVYALCTRQNPTNPHFDCSASPCGGDPAVASGPRTTLEAVLLPASCR